MRGHPFGPGGNGGHFRFDIQYRGISTKTARMTVPVVESWTDMVGKVQRPQLFLRRFIAERTNHKAGVRKVLLLAC